MDESLELLKLQTLLCFENEEPSLCTVTELSKRFNEGKQKISRLLMSMEKDGLLDRSDPRRPVLTEAGRRQAAYYAERTDVILNHLLYEGLDLSTAEHDACAWALFNSEACMQILRDSEQRYRAKYELRRQSEFDGDELCRHLRDGEYRFPFLIYREQVHDGNNLSMANEGFEHPCVLAVKGGEGRILLRPVEMMRKSRMTGREMSGRVRNLRYLDDGRFCQTTEEGALLSFPARTLRFINMGQGIGQILHGSVCLKMQCSVGTVHMPDSQAIFTILI